MHIRFGATITIRDSITITLTNIDKSQVKLCIEASGRNGRGDWIRTSDLLNPIQKKGIFNTFHNCLI